MEGLINYFKRFRFGVGNFFMIAINLITHTYIYPSLCLFNGYLLTAYYVTSSVAGISFTLENKLHIVAVFVNLYRSWKSG